MHSSRPLALALALLSTVVGCDQLKAKLGKGGADASVTADIDASAATAGAADAGAVATAEPAPKNAASVAKFGNENPLDTAATIKRPNVRVTAAIPSGADVTTLPAGTAVKQVAEKGGFYRITFADPKDPSSRLTGWVDKLSFVEPAAPVATAKGKKPIHCAKNLVLAGSDEHATPVCSKVCAKDEDCPGGECQVAFTFEESTLVMQALPASRTSVCVGSAPAAKPGAADAGAAPAWKVGDAVQVEWRGSWYPAKVIGVSNGKYRIHYDGYGNEWDEFVGPSRMKKR